MSKSRCLRLSVLSFSGMPGGAALLTLLLTAGPLTAQEDGVSTTLDLGFVNATGNTDITTFNLGQELLVSTGPWGVKQTFGSVYGKSDGEVSASSWRASARGDRTVAGRLGVYLLVAWDRNVFAGISRRFEEGAGLVFRAVDGPTDLVELEAGAGFTQQRSTEDVSESFTSARAAATYRRTLGESSHAQLTSEILPSLENSEDFRVNSVAELVAPISQRIATKLAYTLRYDREPQPGFGTTDRVFTVGLQLTF